MASEQNIQISAPHKLWQEIQEAHEYPLSITLCLTERCCLSCPHCCLNPIPSRNELCLKEIISIMDELVSLGVIKLCLTGGEAGLREDLYDIVRNARERNFEVTLKTNAFLFSEENIDKLWCAGLNALHVSIYHTNQEKHDQFVGQIGAWKKAVNALKRFYNKGGRCMLLTPIMNWNSSVVSDLIDLCNRNGWHPLIDLKITHREDGSDKPLQFVASESAILSVLDDQRITKIASTHHDLTKRPCNAGFSTAYISPNGLVRACGSLPWIFGNLREKSFKEIWHNSPVRKRVLSIRWDGSPACCGCQFETYCNRCLGESVLEHGDPNRPSTMDCFLAKIQYQHAYKCS